MKRIEVDQNHQREMINIEVVEDIDRDLGLNHQETDTTKDQRDHIDREIEDHQRGWITEEKDQKVIRVRNKDKKS